MTFNPKKRDGIDDSARVGVPAFSLPPPPKIQRMTGLNRDEREVEENFAAAFEKDPDAMADDMRRKMSEIVGHEEDTGKPIYGLGNTAPHVFGTDDAKMLSPDYKASKEARGFYNLATHQVANAVAKRAFIKHLDDLDKLPPGDPRRTILITSGGVACHGEDTPILMYDGSIRAVQDVRLGDRVMGPDSQPRTVLSEHRGTGPLYDVVPKRGSSFVVNDEHVLSLKEISRNRSRPHRWRTVNMTVKEVLGRGDRFRKNSWLYRTGVKFPAVKVPLDPYFLGLWLGDGTHSLPSVTTADPEIAAFLGQFTTTFPHVSLKVYQKQAGGLSGATVNRAKTYQISGSSGLKNPVTELLKGLAVLKNKHIPKLYLVNSRKVRLNLLAGLLDSDGYLDKKGGFEFVTKDKRMAEAVAFLARSLGFWASPPAVKKVLYRGKLRDYYRLHIGGVVEQIPTLIKRKQAEARNDRRSNGRRSKDSLHTGYVLRSRGVGQFYGFTLDADGLYLLGDFTVTHNSGKGYALDNIDAAKSVADKVGAVWDAAGEQNATENPWIYKEAVKRNLTPVFAFVDADPTKTWENPGRGVMERSAKKGRMVDAHLYGDSYGLGARNFQNFHGQRETKYPKAKFIIMENRDRVIGKNPDGSEKRGPRLLTDFPKEALVNQRTVYQRASKVLASRTDLPAHVRHGGSIGNRVWGALNGG